MSLNVTGEGAIRQHTYDCRLLVHFMIVTANQSCRPTM